MLTIRNRLFAALEAICERLMIPPGASVQEKDAAIQEAWSIAHEACAYRDTWETEAALQLDTELSELPD